MAAELSEKYQLADVQTLLNTCISQLIGNKSKNLSVAQLYQKAGNFLQAAKIVFDVGIFSTKKTRLYYFFRLRTTSIWDRRLRFGSKNYM